MGRWYPTEPGKFEAAEFWSYIRYSLTVKKERKSEVQFETFPIPSDFVVGLWLQLTAVIVLA